MTRKPNLLRCLAELALTHSVQIVDADGRAHTVDLDDYLTAEPPVGIVRATVRDAQSTQAKIQGRN